MKVILVLFALMVLGSSRVAAKANDMISDKITAILEQAKSNIDALPEVVDIIKDITLEIDCGYESGTITINQLSLHGLKTFNYAVANTEYGGLRYYETDVYFTEIGVNVDIDVDIKGVLNIKQHFTVATDIHDLYHQSYAVLSDDPLQMVEHQTILSVIDAIIKVEGLGSEEFSQHINQVLTEYTASLFNYIVEVLIDPYDRIVQFVVNVILKLKQ